MRFLVVLSAVVALAAANSSDYVRNIKKRNSHLSHPPVPHNPPEPGQYAAGSQAQYTQLYGGPSQDAYGQLYGDGQQPQQQAGRGGYQQPEPEEDDAAEEYQPGYGRQPQPQYQRPPATTSTTRRPVTPARRKAGGYGSPSVTYTRTTRRPPPTAAPARRQAGYGAQPLQRKAAPATTRKPVWQPKPTVRRYTTTAAPRKAGGYANADLDEIDTPGYGQPQPQLQQKVRPQSSYGQPAVAQPTASRGSYGNDLEDVEQPSYGGRAPVTASRQTSQGSYSNADLETVEQVGYGSAVRQPAQTSYGQQTAAKPARRASSGYNTARELPNPDAASTLTHADYFTAGSNPDYFPALTSAGWASPAVAPYPAFGLRFQTVHQEQPAVGYVLVDGAPQW